MIGCMIGSLAMIRSGSRRQAIHPIHAAPHRSGEHGDLTAAIFSIFDEHRNPLKRQASPILDPPKKDKMQPFLDSDSPQAP
jgi:hypothetical protein